MSFIAPLQTGVSSLLNSAQAFLASAVVGPTVSPTIVQSLPVQPVAPVVGVLLSQQPSTFLLLRPANPSYLLRYELPVSRQEMAPPVVSFPTVFVPAAVTTLPAEFHPDEGAALEQHAARFQGEAPVQRLRSSHSTSPQGSTRMVIEIPVKGRLGAKKKDGLVFSPGQPPIEFVIPALLGKESSRVAIQPLLGFDFAVDMAVWGRTAVPIAGMVEPRAEIQPKHPVEKKADAIRSNTFSPVPVAKPYIAPKVQYSAPTAARVSVSAAERVLDSNIRMRTTERPADGAEKIPTAVGNTTHSLPRDSRSSRLEEVFSSWTLPFPFPFPFPNISTVVEQPVVRATHFSPFVSAMVQPQFIAHEPHMVIRMALPALTLGHSLRAATFGERRDPSDRVEPVSESADSHSQNGHSGHDTDDQPQDSDQQSS